MDIIENGAVPVARVEVSTPEAARVVNDPVFGVVEPIVPGATHVDPSRRDTLRLGTTVVEETVNGAVPVPTVEIKDPVVVTFPVIYVFESLIIRFDVY